MSDNSGRTRLQRGRPATMPHIPGATYRQLDHWASQGYLHFEQHGTGNRRQWSAEEIRVARLMARLTAAGLTAQRAHYVARHAKNRTTVQLGPGVALVLEQGEDGEPS